MNILLCGMMGCGKTTVATALQMELCWLKVDTDTWIEEEYGSIARIFAEHGEAYFRDLETQAAKRVVMLDRCVVAVGGGFVLREENIVPLKKNGKFVYLRARKETLEKRLGFGKNEFFAKNLEKAPCGFSFSGYILTCRW
jgi:shikimate kinase